MCNAYNAFVINGVVSHKTPPRVNEFAIDGVDFFNLKEHIFAGRTISLDELENQMIRPTFKDPRVHVALVCAAKSCPAIRAEAYTGEQVQKQLQDQSELFSNDPRYVNFDQASNKLELSPILNWYGSDWNDKFPNGGYLRWIAELVRSSELKSKLEEAIVGDIDVTFPEYDWTLNSQSDPKGKSSGKSAASFGSGSIPDE